MFDKKESRVKNALNSSNQVVEKTEVAGKEPLKRPVRVPMSQQFKLSVPKGIEEKGFVYRYIRDEAARVEAFQAAYWEPVSDGYGKPIRKASGNKYLLLYRIKEEYYIEDLKIKKDKTIDLLKEQAKLKKGNDEYIPEGSQAVVTIKQ